MLMKFEVVLTVKPLVVPTRVHLFCEAAVGAYRPISTPFTFKTKVTALLALRSSLAQKKMLTVVPTGMFTVLDSENVPPLVELSPVDRRT